MDSVDGLLNISAKSSIVTILIPKITFIVYSVTCQTPSKTQTDEETRSFVRLTVRLSVVSVRGVHPMGGRSAMLNRNSGRGESGIN